MLVNNTINFKERREMDYRKAAEDFMVAAKHFNKSKMAEQMGRFSQGEILVLMYLHKCTGQPTLPNEIAKYADMSTARIAAILNKLEEKGLITREISHNDRRKILVAVTDKGRTEAKKHKEKALHYVAHILEKMGEQRAESFLENFQLFFEIGSKQIEEESNK